MKWNDDKTITITPPAKPKKITGTRFAAIMGLNKWTSPFNAWCAITRTYEEPFEDTIYTIAGKTIEPKQAEYMKTAYFMSNLITPTDVYGEDYFKKTWGDFFRDIPIFGGMWDYLLVDKEGKPQTVLEMKTTKRSEDWVEDVPEYYNMDMPNRIYSPEGISPTLKTVSGGGGEVKVLKNKLYRKLTPKEYFRLMGFSDSDYQILVDNGISKSQLYKMAGNSIVVTVLENLFKQIYKPVTQSIASLKQQSLDILNNI